MCTSAQQGSRGWRLGLSEPWHSELGAGTAAPVLGTAGVTQILGTLGSTVNVHFGRKNIKDWKK